uniref:Rx N-terminal domain-containing protein n=1 Tax=Leersia perrieri TaxID=77586 RepID=A0A0D9XZR4_9ORYZ
MAESAFVSSLVDRLSTMAMSGLSSMLGATAKERVESLVDELQLLECFLKDTDIMDLRQDETAKQWLNSLRDVAYDAEDLVESAMLQQQGDRFYSLHHPIDSFMFAKKVEEIMSKICDMVDRRASYAAMIRELENESGEEETSTSSRHRRRPPPSPALFLRWRRSSHHMGNSTIFGLEQDTDMIMERLLHRKITLASLVFIKARAVQEGSTSSGQATSSKPTDSGSSSSNRSHFDDPATLLLLNIISTQIGGNFHQEDDDVAAARSDIFEFLLDKRYLIVLDDVWRIETWHELIDALPMSRNGSKILMTTRSKEIAICADPASSPHELNPLSDELSFRLFLSKVFPLGHLHQTSCPPELQDLGRQLSKKCGGLPLALVVLGGLLSGKVNQHIVWSRILNSMNWSDNEAGKQCLKVLALSYNCLPYHMKLCFLYLGAFREESEISISKLTKLWIGDELIPQLGGNTKEDTADDYLNELIQRCLMQPVLLEHKQQPTRVCVHALLRELAISEGRESRFLYCEHSQVVSKMEMKTYRCLALHLGPSKRYDLLDFGKLRALLINPRTTGTQTICVGHQVLRPFFKLIPRWCTINYQWQTVWNMPYIRIIEVQGLQMPMDALQESIKSSLIHLRYLCLRNTCLDAFPFNESKFPSLQTLDIRETSIEKLPDAILDT